MHKKMNMFLILLVVSLICIFECGISAAGTISGRLSNSSNIGIAGVLVSAYGTSGSPPATATTNSNGNFQISNLPQDSYRINYDATSSGYLASWYGGGTCTSTYLSLNGTIDTSMVLPSLSGTGVIQGRITDIYGTGLAYAGAVAYKDYFNYVNTATADVNGNYTLSLSPGSYTIIFSGSYLNIMNGRSFIDEYYNNISTSQFLSAQVIKVTQGSNQTVSAVLEEGGDISGVVKDSYGAVLSNVAVSLYNTSNELLSSTTTASDGTYSFTALFPKSYKVQFSITLLTYSSSTSSPSYSVWYNRATSQNASSVTVTPKSKITGINATIPRGSIAGKISGVDNIAVYNATINLYDTAGNKLNSTTSDSNGNYLFNFVIPGNYKIDFELSNGQLSGWFGNKKSYVDATTVVVSDQSQATADLVLSKLSGKVTDINNNPVVGATLAIYSADIGQNMGSVSTDATGTYKSSPLFPGNYKVYCYGKTAPDGSIYLSQWYPTGSTIVQAADVVLPQSTILTNINIALSSIPTGSVSGHVYDQNNSPIAYARVSLRNQSNSTYASTSTDSSGYYIARTTSTGLYTMLFESPSDAASNYLPSYYSGKSSLAGADFFTLSVPGALTNVDGILLPGGKITGTVRKPDGTAFTFGASVYLYDANNTQLGNTTTQSDGTYSFGKLPSGKYTVKVTYYNYNGYSTMWFNGKSDAATADAIYVTAPLTTASIDFTLPNGVIAGSISYLSGCPPQVQNFNLGGYKTVCAFDALTLTEKKCVGTDNLGNYIIDGLTSGTYKIRFEPDMVNIPGRWYGGGLDSTVSSNIIVQSPNQVSGINMVLTEGSTGKLSVVYRDTDGNPVNGTFTTYDAGGAAIGSLNNYPIGNYKIKAGLYSAILSLYSYSGSTALYNSNFWYDSQPDFASATPVQINAQTTTNITLTYQKKNLSYYYITASRTAGGTYSPATSQLVRYGQTVTYTFFPSNGYEIKDVKIDDVSVGSVTSYTFSNISASHSVYVAYDVKAVDTTAPLISSFLLPQTTQTRIIPVAELIASDDSNNIAGWLIKENADIPLNSDSAWVSTLPSTYTTLATNGFIMLYAFAKDATGNISQSKTASTTISLPQLSVSVTGSGSGTVTSKPAAMSCTTGICQPVFDYGTTVTLLQTPSVISLFNGWSGNCTGTGDCIVYMDGTKAVTATFTLVPKIKLDLNATSGYDTFLDVYTNSTGLTYYSINTIIPGNWFMGGLKNILLKGGYQSDYKTRTGFTVLNGKLTVKGGSLRVDGVKIR